MEEVIIEPVVEDAAPAAPVEVETPVVVEESLEEEAEKALKVSFHLIFCSFLD